MATVNPVRPTALLRQEWFKTTASTAYGYRELIQADEDATGNAFISATASTERILGIINAAVVSTDGDYATSHREPLLIDEMGEWEFAVGTGSADTNDEQGYVDLKDKDEVDVTASAVDNVFVTRFVATAKVRGHITCWSNTSRPSVD